MKKVFSLFLSVALFSLIFISCQSTEDITSPVDLNKPTPKLLNWGNPNPINGYEYIDLVAGQNNPVGKVYITKESNGDITVKYSLNSSDCKITEVHVDIAKDLGIYSSSLLGGFHVNSQGNPQHGLFDKNLSFGEGTSEDVVVTFKASEMQQWLGVSNYSGKLYIAVHAGVCCPTGTVSGEANYCLDLSEYAKFSTNGSHYNPYVFNPVKVYDANENYLTQFSAWCVDPVRGFDRDVIYNARFISTACDPLPVDISCIIKNPDNLDLLNYLINNFEAGNTYQGIGNVDNAVYQAVIWKITYGSYQTNSNFNPDITVVEALYSFVVTNGEGYKPQCGDKMAIIVVDADYNYCSPQTWLGYQPLIIWKTIECTSQTIYDCETAYGFKYQPDNTSSLFPNHVWFRYNGFNY